MRSGLRGRTAGRALTALAVAALLTGCGSSSKATAPTPPTAGAAASATGTAATGGSAQTGAPTASGADTAGAAAGGTGGAPTAPAAVPGTGSTTSTPGPAATGSTDPKARLAAIGIRPGDLPAAWKSAPGSNDTASSDATHAQLVGCVGAPDSTKSRTAQAGSLEWTQGQQSIDSTVTAYSTQAAASADALAFRSPKLEGCFRKIVAAAFTSGLAPGSSAALTAFSAQQRAAGDPPSVVARVQATITVTSAEQPAVVVVSAVYLEGPLTQAEVDFTAEGAQVPVDLQTSLVNTIATRVTAG